jgi:hypothetical protein
MANEDTKDIWTDVNEMYADIQDMLCKIPVGKLAEISVIEPTFLGNFEKFCGKDTADIIRNEAVKTLNKQLELLRR